MKTTLLRFTNNLLKKKRKFPEQVLISIAATGKSLLLPRAMMDPLRRLFRGPRVMMRVRKLRVFVNLYNKKLNR